MTQPNRRHLQYTAHSLSVARRRYVRSRELFAAGETEEVARLLFLVLRALRRNARLLRAKLDLVRIATVERATSSLRSSDGTSLNPETLLDIDSLDGMLDELVEISERRRTTARGLTSLAPETAFDDLEAQTA